MFRLEPTLLIIDNILKIRTAGFELFQNNQD